MDHKLTCPKCGKEDTFYHWGAPTTCRCFCGNTFPFPPIEMSTPNTPTPRTDRNAIYMVNSTTAIDFARQLERELAEAKMPFMGVPCEDCGGIGCDCPSPLAKANARLAKVLQALREIIPFIAAMLPIIERLKPSVTEDTEAWLAKAKELVK